VQRLHPERQSEIIAILNAIECHVEEGQGDPGVLRHLADALVAMAAIAQLDACAVTVMTGKLDRLRDRVGQALG
jgi:hypothetical protein